MKTGQEVKVNLEFAATRQGEVDWKPDTGSEIRADEVVGAYESVGIIRLRQTKDSGVVMKAEHRSFGGPEDPDQPLLACGK